MAPVTAYISDGVTWHQANVAMSDGVVWSGADITINPAAVSGDTELVFHITSALTQNLYLTQSQANGVVINWGDGSQAETYSELSVHASHTYDVAGDYVVTIGAASGVTWSPGAVIQTVNSNNETISRDYGLLGNFTETNGKSGMIYSSFPTLTAFSFGTGATLHRPRAFAGATSLKEIILPPGLTAIPDYTFAQCTSLRNVVYSDTITSVGQKAFMNCQYFDCARLASQLTTIGAYAFSHCSGEAGYIELKATSVGVAAFEYCSGLRRIWLRNVITDLYVQEKTKTSDGVTTVSEYIGPFYQCDEELILYAECYEIDKPAGWMDHFNAHSETTKVFLVIWHQTTAPFVSLRIEWNAHGRALSFIDDNDLEVGYEYDPIDSSLTVN